MNQFTTGIAIGAAATFIILKAFGVLTIGWFWALLPAILIILFFAGLFAVATLIIGLAAWLDRS